MDDHARSHRTTAEKFKVEFVRLDGSVPQKKRQALVSEFQTSARCRFFLTTNAGSTGLNLQAANTIVNVDLPWNPAILEQRIARAHRMGQTRPVHVYVLVTEETLEENLLSTLSAKRDLALAALDAQSELSEVDVRSGNAELKERLERLLGAKPEAPIDQTVEDGIERPAERTRLLETGEGFMRAALAFLGELAGDAPAAEALARDLHPRLARDEHGRTRLSVALPALEDLGTFARKLLDAVGSRPEPTRTVSRAAESPSATRTRGSKISPASA